MSLEEAAGWAAAALWGSRLGWLLMHLGGRRGVAPMQRDGARRGISAAPPATRELTAAVRRHFGVAPSSSDDPLAGGPLLVVPREQQLRRADALEAGAVLSVVLPDASTPPLTRAPHGTTERPCAPRADLVPRPRPTSGGRTTDDDLDDATRGPAGLRPAAASSDPAADAGD